MKFFRPTFAGTAAAVLVVCVEASNCIGPNNDTQAPCVPGHEWCGAPFTDAPVFHLMDQHGCAENDPNGPVFDPVHGVFHHFYQIHLAATPGHGPDYGHFVSKDFLHWAPLPVAIWNGFDSSVEPWKVTKYDNEAIFTGSAIVVDGAGPKGVPGIVNIYPGLCNKNDWPGCETGTLLAQAVPADYEGDELLVEWTKPDYNPIMENTQRDPSTPWQTSHGEWRLRTYDSSVYAAASKEDLLAGKWYSIGKNPDFRTCECPSFYPLPAPTPGTEELYNELVAASALPTHVHKTSCSGDWWQVGTYVEGAPKVLGSFNATAGWEDLFTQKRIDQGAFYASKDNVYPTLSGGDRRVNWGWAQVAPASTQTLPREITFNAAARTLQQLPIDELTNLRGSAVYVKDDTFNGTVPLGLDKGIAKQSEIVAIFDLPTAAAKLSVNIGSGGPGTTVTRLMDKTDLPGDDYNITHHPKGTPATVCQQACDADSECLAWTYVIRGTDGGGDCCKKSSVPCPVTSSPVDPQCTSGAKTATSVSGCGGSGETTTCTIDFEPPTNTSAWFYEVNANCNGIQDVLRILTSETTAEIRMYADATIVEAFFQQGRVAMTVKSGLTDDADISFASTASSFKANVAVYPIDQIWVSEDDVRKAPRVYE